MKFTMFDNKMPPACEYCERGRLSADRKMILCVKKGIVAPYYKCKSFVYSPLKRVPKRMQKLPGFTAEDFKL